MGRIHENVRSKDDSAVSPRSGRMAAVVSSYQLDQIHLGEEDVLGFDVPMQHLPVVYVFECQRRLQEPVDDLLLGERAEATLLLT